MAATVYGAYGSPFVRKVLICLEEKGVPYEIEATIPGQFGPEYKKIHPMGKIPAFKDDKVTLPDSSVICAYLEKVYPKPSLIPQDPADFGRALWFEEYGDSAMAQVIGGKIFFPKILGPLLFNRPLDEAAVAKAVKEDLPVPLDYLEGQLQGKDYLVGNSFSLADLGVGTHFVNLLLCGIEVDGKRWPNLKKYVDRLFQRPSFQKLIEKEKAIFQGAA